MELCTTFERVDTNNVQSVPNNMILDRFGFKLQVINISIDGIGSIALGCLNSHCPWLFEFTSCEKCEFFGQIRTELSQNIIYDININADMAMDSIDQSDSESILGTIFLFHNLTSGIMIERSIILM
jgi:hypothetical protein